MNFQIKATRVALDIATADVIGDVDLYRAPEFQDALEKIITKGCYNLVINLSKVNFMDSSGLGVLLGALKKVEQFKGKINIVSSKENLHKLFRISGLVHTFGIYDSVHEALKALRSPTQPLSYAALAS